VSQASGELTIALRDADAERTVTLAKDSVFVVPRGVEHRPSSMECASILMFEQAGTVNTGDQHEQLPEHITTTTGHALT
jgi:mannose-6-phosphate isomerase-like protein (cupin superfamily)